MNAAGEELGISFDFGVDVGNTFDSHRAIMWAGTLDDDTAQEKLANILGKNHFENKRCVATHKSILV